MEYHLEDGSGVTIRQKKYASGAFWAPLKKDVPFVRKEEGSWGDLVLLPDSRGAERELLQVHRLRAHHRRMGVPAAHRLIEQVGIVLFLSCSFARERQLR